MVLGYEKHPFLPGIKEFLEEKGKQEKIIEEVQDNSNKILDGEKYITYEDLTPDQKRIVDDYEKGLYNEYELKNNQTEVIRLSKKSRVIHENYESYGLNILDGQIKSIKFFFNIGKKRVGFEVLIDNYKFVEKELEEKYGGSYPIYSIRDLDIGEIGKKLKSGYNYVDKINYFRYLGLEFSDVKNFIEQVLLDYHKNIKKDI